MMVEMMMIMIIMEVNVIATVILMMVEVMMCYDDNCKIHIIMIMMKS
jgi:hypothetical protein